MEAVIQRILAAYETAELDLLAILARQVLDGIDTEDVDTWAQQKQKYRNIKGLRQEIKAVVDSLEGLDEAARDLVIQQYLAGGSQYVEGFIATNTQAVNALALDIEKRLINARFQILRQTDDAYRRIVSQAIEQSVLGMDARLTTARTALAKFAGDGITGYTSRDGKQYDIRSYVEMATRTGLNNAFREGRIAGVTQIGKDLIIISSHANPSPDCRPYERKVLSINGANGYTSLNEAKTHGLFHPNCKHSFTLYTPGLTKIGESEADKGADDYEATQDLRYAERKTREWKRRLTVAATPKEQAKCKAKIKQWRDEAKTIAADNNLNVKSNRFSNIQAR